MFLILILMFFLGCVQVPWALIQGLATKNPQTRRHFGYYGLGVVAYFAILLPLWSGLDRLDANPFLLIHFFGGAWGLAFYHFWIVSTNVAQRDEVRSQGDPFVPTEAEV